MKNGTLDLMGSKDSATSRGPRLKHGGNEKEFGAGLSQTVTQPSNKKGFHSLWGVYSGEGDVKGGKKETWGITKTVANGLYQTSSGGFSNLY